MSREGQATTSQTPVRTVRRRRPVLRPLTTLCVWSVIGLMGALVLSITLPPLFGYQVLNVLSGSMEPNIPTGAVIWDEVIDPRDAKVGDVVTFTDPEDKNRLITHRVRKITVKGSRARVITQGDANNTVERWTVPLKTKIGRVIYHVPKLAYARVWLTGRTGGLGIGIAIVLLILTAIIEIWRPRRTEDSPEIAV